jgi:hypothetical protein
MTQKPIYIKPESDKIYISRGHDSNSNILSGVATLRNLTDKYLLYKAMLNKPQEYSANPACSFIVPNGKVEVTIKRFYTPDISTKGDFFLFKSYPVNEVITDVS